MCRCHIWSATPPRCPPLTRRGTYCSRAHRHSSPTHSFRCQKEAAQGGCVGVRDQKRNGCVGAKRGAGWVSLTCARCAAPLLPSARCGGVSDAMREHDQAPPLPSPQCAMLLSICHMPYHMDLLSDQFLMPTHCVDLPACRSLTPRARPSKS